MKPFRAFLFLLAILISFLSILYFFDFRKTQPEELIPTNEEIADQSDSLVRIPIIAEIDSTSLDPIISQKPVESLALESFLLSTSLKNPQAFQYSISDSVNFNYLSRKLLNIDDESLPIRILYFGDSQIENDRITSKLRRVLQAHFGGRGMGFIPLDQLYNSSHQLILEQSKEKKKKSVLDKDFVSSSLLFKQSKLGQSDEEGWFRIKRIKSLGPKPDYKLMKLYYKLTGFCQLAVKNSGELIYAGGLPNGGVLNVMDFQFNRTPEDLKLGFKIDGLLDVYGLSLETKKGVLVDNIALRGLSYPTFEWSDKKSMLQMIDKVNPGMFIFHFGVNLVPYQSEDYVYFRTHFKRQMLFLREAYPDVPFLIVGVSDMAKKKDGKMISYSNISQIKNIQKEVASETGAIFWDLEAFMGGSGGMINWAKANPKLGKKDYTHFTKEGADVIGEELARMIINQVENDSRTRK